jgi:hypothetical protein
MTDPNPRFIDQASEAEKAADTAAPAEAHGCSEPAPPICRCGRGPWRKGQRNCLTCNREANKRYRESLRKEEARLRLRRHS